jgi:hypothetical protein
MKPGQTRPAFTVMVAARYMPAASPEALGLSAWETHRDTIKHPSLLSNPPTSPVPGRTSPSAAAVAVSPPGGLIDGMTERIPRTFPFAAS